MQDAVKTFYSPPNPDLWQGRKDSNPNERFFQIVQSISESELGSLKAGLVMIGFRSDEGVKRNFGRLGAANGPDHIRQQLAKLPAFSKQPIYDLGDIHCDNGLLEASQEALAALINSCHLSNHKTLILGGGHETAWGHYLGLKQICSELSFINFDAHFDLRQSHQSTSGTPFLQIAKDKQALTQPFNYFCYGIQQLANTQTLFDTAESLNVQYLTTHDVFQTPVSSQQSQLQKFIEKQQHIYLSLCLDVFSSAVAPGVSAPQPMGVMPWQVMPMLATVMQSKKVVSVDIVELAPNFDVDQTTARLASQLAAEVVCSL